MITKKFKYFSKSEFKCKCCGENAINDKLIDMLDIARGIVGVPFIVNSGYRCIYHNEKVGGRANSSHLKGLAVDIKLHSGHEKYKILDAMYKAGFKRIGVYDNFIHVDIDLDKPQEAMW